MYQLYFCALVGCLSILKGWAIRATGLQGLRVKGTWGLDGQGLLGLEFRGQGRGYQVQSLQGKIGQGLVSLESLGQNRVVLVETLWGGQQAQSLQVRIGQTWSIQGGMIRQVQSLEVSSPKLLGQRRVGQGLGSIELRQF